MSETKRIKLQLLLLNENTKATWEALSFDKKRSYGLLVKKSGLKRSTLYDALRRLEKEGFVRRFVDKPKGDKGGRPKTRWKAI